MIWPHRIMLLKALRSESDIGGTSYSYPGTGPVYAAFVQPQRESLSVVNDIGGVDMVVTVFIQPGAPVEATDRMIFESRTYEFTGAINQYGQLGANHVKAVARLLDVQS
jgi:hypothetical protein